MLIDEVELKHRGELFDMCDTADCPWNVVPNCRISFGEGVHTPSYSEFLLRCCMARRVAVMGTSWLIMMDVMDVADIECHPCGPLGASLVYTLYRL